MELKENMVKGLEVVIFHAISRASFVERVNNELKRKTYYHASLYYICKWHFIKKVFPKQKKDPNMTALTVWNGFVMLMCSNHSKCLNKVKVSVYIEK